MTTVQDNLLLLVTQERFDPLEETSRNAATMKLPKEMVVRDSIKHLLEVNIDYIDGVFMLY